MSLNIYVIVTYVIAIELLVSVGFSLFIKWHINLHGLFNSNAKAILIEKLFNPQLVGMREFIPFLRVLG